MDPYDILFDDVHKLSDQDVTFVKLLTYEHSFPFCFLFRQHYGFMVVFHFQEHNRFEIELIVAHNTQDALIPFTSEEYPIIDPDLHKQLVRCSYFLMDLLEKKQVFIRDDLSFHDNKTKDIIEHFWM